MKKKVEFLIVGQGLAGSLLAFEMLKHNIDFKIVSAPKKAKASLVAAGMINPLVFKRLTKSWMVDDLLPEMKSTYEKVEGYLGEKILHSIPILKPLSEQEKVLWEEKIQLPDFAKYINKISDKSPVDGISDAAAFAEVAHSGYLEIARFLQLAEEFFKSKKLQFDYDFNFRNFQPPYSDFEIGDIKVSRVIFCEGYHITKNNVFDFVKVRPVKGEVLQIFAPFLSEKYLLNKKVFVLPVGNHRFKVGSTYNWQQLNEDISKEGKVSIINRLVKLVDTPFKIEKQVAGVRPTVIDRRPVLGHHPEFKNLSVFNGLGTKGVMLAPFFAKEMLRFLTQRNVELNNEVNVLRFLNK